MVNELLIKNGRVIDPANGIDKKCDVLIVDGKIAEVEGKTEDRRQKTEDRGQKTENRGQKTDSFLTSDI